MQVSLPVKYVPDILLCNASDFTVFVNVERSSGKIAKHQEIGLGGRVGFVAMGATVHISITTHVSYVLP